MKTVTFCGHSSLSADENNSVESKLHIIIENLIMQGATEFLLGGYGDFDVACAKCVKTLKEKYPHIISVLVVPYIDRDYDKSLYDCSEYPPIECVPKRYAISKRNKYMVDKSQVVVALVNHSWGGAAKTFDYAQRKKKDIIQIK